MGFLDLYLSCLPCLLCLFSSLLSFSMFLSYLRYLSYFSLWTVASFFLFFLSISIFLRRSIKSLCTTEDCSLILITYSYCSVKNFNFSSIYLKRRVNSRELDASFCYTPSITGGSGNLCNFLCIFINSYIKWLCFYDPINVGLSNIDLEITSFILGFYLNGVVILWYFSNAVSLLFCKFSMLSWILPISLISLFSKSLFLPM